MSEDLLMNIHVDDVQRRLFVSRQKENKSGALSPCNMSPDDVDYEISQGKDKRILEICDMNQESLEYFVERYGETYLDRLYVHKDYQRQGVATALCNELERGFDRITTHASITAKPFFLHRGYKVVREQQVVRNGISLTNYVMEK